MIANSTESYSTPGVPRVGAVAAQNGDSRVVAYTKPILKMFPPTSEWTAKVTMMTVYGLMAITIVFIVLREAGLYS
ncbi:hypothetical protein [Rhodococcus marinonascens]|uniref:hypothetical protein n=1 Tax=Rhodococcus marinonascens TaxID=38311 RepID=UPI0009351BD1|nr:hypothetical protein [Rhodococcus marinonascens]